MLLTLLLQTTSVKTSDLNAVYLALGGTLVAALIAAASSFVASSRAAKTAEKVIALSTQTTQDVAALSAQVSRESATLAARTAQELKDKDYKNDFYKKILDKRFQAWSEAEELLKLLVNTLVDSNDQKLIPAYFGSAEDFDKVMEKIRSMVTHTFWMGKDYADHLTNFYDTLLSIREGCLMKTGEKNSHGMPAADSKLLIIAGKKILCYL